MKKIGLALLILLGGCSTKEAPQLFEIHYYKDDRTGLCFASTSSVLANNFTLTCVPCSKEVELLLNK